MIDLLFGLCPYLAQIVLAGIWQGFALVLAVAIVLRMLPHLHAAARFGVWAVTFAAVIALPLLHGTAAQPASGPTVHVSIGWAAVVAAFWVGFAVFRVGQLLAQAARLRGIWKRAVPVDAGEAIGSLLRLSGRTPALCTSSDVDAPSVIGFFSPRLLVPEWFYPTLSEAELRQIVLHECEHLRRGDDWLNLLQKLALAVFPLSPALLFADRRLSLERELACDAGVVAATAAPFDYASCLTRLAEQRLGRRRSLALALSAWSRRSELARRVHRLLQPARAMTTAQLRSSLAVLALGLCGGACELARAPQFIAFTNPMAALAEAPSAPVGQVAGPVRAVPVVYRQPVQLLSQPVVRRDARKRLHNPVVRTLAVEQPATQSRHPHLLLTISESGVSSDEQVTSTASPRVMNAGWNDLSPTYAAVPFAGGWLIIQL